MAWEDGLQAEGAEGREEAREREKRLEKKEDKIVHLSKERGSNVLIWAICCNFPNLLTLGEIASLQIAGLGDLHRMNWERRGGGIFFHHRKLQLANSFVSCYSTWMHQPRCGEQAGSVFPPLSQEQLTNKVKQDGQKRSLKGF